jgi:hypothetical protein
VSYYFIISNKGELIFFIFFIVLWIMRVKNFELIILDSNSKPYPERFHNDRWIIGSTPGKTFKVRVKIYQDSLPVSTYYQCVLFIDGKEEPVKKNIQFLPSENTSFVDFSGFVTEKGNFEFLFNEIDSANTSSSSSVVESQNFGTITVVVYEGIPTVDSLLPKTKVSRTSRSTEVPEKAMCAHGNQSTRVSNPNQVTGESKIGYYWNRGKKLQSLTVNYQDKKVLKLLGSLGKENTRKSDELDDPQSQKAPKKPKTVKPRRKKPLTREDYAWFLFACMQVFPTLRPASLASTQDNPDKTPAVKESNL